MRRYVAAVLMAILAAFPVFAGTATPLSGLEVPGMTVQYDRTLGRVVLGSGSSEVVILIDYPYLISGGRIIRLDAAPVIDGRDVMLSDFTAARIKEELPAPVRTETPGTITIKTGATPEMTAETVSPAGQAAQACVKATPAPVRKHAKYRAWVKKTYPTATAVAEMPASATPVASERGNRPTKRKLIVIDPGHGGNDPGAMGRHGLQEKDVVLAVALDVKKDLGDYPADVLITRETDDFITLKGRTVFANARKADIFVSIHCNSSPDPQVCGTRTYIYNRVASSKEAAEAARYENKQEGAFEFLMNDLRKSAYEYLSIELAGNIQHAMSDELKFKWMAAERAPFYVLANTDMPAVLVETAFISNSREEQEMKTPDFRAKIADGIAKGIEDYFSKIQ